MKETKYDKNDFPDALLKEWDKTRKQILASAKLMLDPPDRKKDPREDQEQMEYLEAWKKKHERTDKEK